MDQSQALSGFGALSQENRLEIVRLLVRAGPDGLPAGEIAEAVGISPSNLTFHLKGIGENAKLVAGRRESRLMIYSANYLALRGLVDFLMRDCCAGHPKICQPAPVRKVRGRVPA